MHGLYLLWWVQKKHVSAFAVAVMLAAGDLALMALEVPTGWFADRFGHRTSLILGSMAQVLGMLLCWLGQGISGLLAASLFVALGDGFRSRKALAVRMTPFRQKPHCAACSSMKAF